MKASYFLMLFCVTCTIIGCSREEPIQSLDEVIDALPDEWGTRHNTGASSNNFAVVDRINGVTNVLERIRLSWKLFNHFRHTPEWHVEHLGGGFSRGQRYALLCNCSWNLMVGTNTTPETILAGWKIRAEIIKDLEGVIRLTDLGWQEILRRQFDAKIESDLKKYGTAGGSSKELDFAAEVRQDYDRYFKCSFTGGASYRRLPNDMKSEFVELLKRDFFRCSGMTNVNMKNYPPELKEAYMEVRKQMESK